MVFSSITFLFLFLPLTLALYFIVPKTWKNYLLLAASLFFYAWGEKVFVLIMLGSILLNYVSALLIERYRDCNRDRVILVGALVANLGLLVVFKYANFLVENLNIVLPRLGFDPMIWSPIHLPIGISFFTFQALSYVVDVYRREVKADRNPSGVALYIALFPQLIAGPIVRYQEVAREIMERSVRFGDFATGVRRFMIGFAKKMLLANTLAVPADQIFSLGPGALGCGVAWLGVVCYAFQIYFDFSGYSDMAIGLGRMFGFKFNENFNYPYVSQSVTEFWRRWHISLSTWFRDYLYIPLGGNRAGTGRTYFNLVLVFFLCGLWHGASWSFIIWGLMHGAVLVIERVALGSWLRKLPSAVRHGYLVLAILISWVFFRADNVTEAFAYLAAMFGAIPAGPAEATAARFVDAEILLTLTVATVACLPVRPWIRNRMANLSTGSEAIARPAVPFIVNAFCAGVFFVSVLWLASGTHNPFIYFRF